MERSRGLCGYLLLECHEQHASIYVATAGIVMSNCVKVCTSIDKPIYSVLQTAVHSSFLPIIISLTLHGQVVCSSFSTSVVVISTHSG